MTAKKNGEVPFSERLRDLLKRRGWSTYDLAAKAELSEPYISMLCTGVRNPSDATKVAIAQAFGMKAHKLMEGVRYG